MRVFPLGLRLIVGAGKSRLAMIVGATALGVCLLLLLSTYPEAAQMTVSGRSNRVVFQIITALLSLPLAFMVVAATRLRAESRDRRLAVLRLLGLSKALTARVAVYETAIPVAVGCLVGILLATWLAVPLGDEMVQLGWLKRFPHVSLAAATAATLVTTAGAGLAAARPAFRSGEESLGAARPGPRRLRFRAFGTGISLIGLALAIFLAFRPQAHGSARPSWVIPGLFLAGVALSIGLVSLTHWLISLFAKLLRRRRTALCVMVATRMQGDAAALARSLGGLVIATFASTVGVCVFSAWTTTPQYVSTHWAKDHAVVVSARAETSDLPHLVKALTKNPRVERAVPLARITPAHWEHSGLGVAALSCADISELTTVVGCRDDVPWVVQDTDDPSGVGKARGSEVKVTVNKRTIQLKPTTIGRINSRLPRGSWGNTWLPSGTIVASPAVLGSNPPPSEVLVKVAAGTGDVEVLPTKADDSGLYVATGDWQSFEEAESYRRVLWALMAVVMAVGFGTFAMTSIDLALERRRRVASLRMAGTPASLLRQAQWYALVLPSAVSIIVALGLGGLLGRSYLNMGGYPQVLPWRELVAVAAISLIVAGMFGALSTIGIGRPLTADLIRRE